MNNSKTYLVSIISGLLLFNLGSVYASPMKWKALSSIEKKVLQPHARKWNAYSEEKQDLLLDRSRKEINGLNASKKWFQEKLTKKERIVFAANMKKMSAKNFHKYVDALMKKHGRPKH